MKNKLSHINDSNQPRMVDVTSKPQSVRQAVARGCIRISEETVRQISANEIKKGNVLVTAELAGVMAAKRTPEWIPLCHTLLLTKVDVSAELVAQAVEVTATVRCVGQTGVEMEALTAVSAALLTVYDMCKAVDKQMVMEQIYLVQKEKTERQ